MEPRELTIAGGDRMKKRAGDAATLAAALAQHATFTVADFRQRRVVTRRDERRIMEFMAAHDLTFRAEHAI
jgi:hypothetical protein